MGRRGEALIDGLAVAVGSCGLAGFFPVAPATFASAVATVVLAFVYPLPVLSAYIGLLAALFLVGTWAATRMERLYGHDPAAAVIDEVLGMALTLAWVQGTPALGAAAAVPAAGKLMTMAPVQLLLGFLLFRLFDILKLPPGRALERLPGGWGVMADDACAGLYAALALQGLLRLWPEPRLAAWQLLPAAAAAGVLLVFRRPLVRRYSKARSRLRAGRRGAG